MQIPWEATVMKLVETVQVADRAATRQDYASVLKASTAKRAIKCPHTTNLLLCVLYWTENTSIILVN